VILKTSTPSTKLIQQNVLNMKIRRITAGVPPNAAGEITLASEMKCRTLKCKNEEATRQQGSLFFKGE